MGSITNCYATGSVSGISDIGGLAGCNDYNTITNSYATGNVTGTSNIGGLVGLNSSNVINSYAVGGVSGSSGVGGLVGNNYYYSSTDTATVTDGYWNATVKSTGCGTNTGTFAATGMALANMQTQVFANTLTANIDSLNLSGCAGWKYSTSINNGYPVLQGVGNGVSTTDTTPPTISTYAFQDFASGTETIHATVTDDDSGVAVQKYASGTQAVSYFASNGTSFSSSIISGLTIGTYTIYAKDNAGNETTQVVTYTAVAGSGTSTDPYIITTAYQLAEISTGLAKYYKLGNDIDWEQYGTVYRKF
jgi:hypothetical protein